MILVTINGEVAELSLDSGCEGDCIQEAECRRLKLKIDELDETDTMPTQADGNSNLNVIGKTKFTCIRDKMQFTFEGYVVTTLQARILCGGSFLASSSRTS